MSNFTQTIVIAKDLADKAGLPLDKFLAAAVELAKHEAEQEKARSAWPEEKERILQALQEMNGQITEDLPPAEICAAAGVRRVQGTMSYARYQIKQLLLEHKTQ